MSNLLIHGYRLTLSCFACPQQFDVYDNENTYVAYIRIRHGKIRVHCPDFGGDVVYESSILGDGLLLDEEQLHHLYKAVECIQSWILKQPYKKLAEWELEMKITLNKLIV